MASPIGDSPLAILTFIAAPAVFTNAASVLSLGTGNRLARVVDRTRQLADELRKDSSDNPLNQMYLRQLARLDRRADRLVRGMTCFYTAVGAFAPPARLRYLAQVWLLQDSVFPFRLLPSLALRPALSDLSDWLRVRSC